MKIIVMMSLLLALCPDKDYPANGMVSQSGNSVGDTATFVCNDGYELVGSPVLTCQDNGTWDNSPAVCKRELISNRQQPSRLLH